MTRVLLAGMTPQTASAVELMVRSEFGAVDIARHDRALQRTPAALAPQILPDDLLVLDLMGLGWALCTPARAQSLGRDLLATRPAVLLLPPEAAAPGGHGGWASAVAAAGSGSGSALRLAVPHPASMTSMRHALRQLHSALQAGAAAPPPSAPAPVPDTAPDTADWADTRPPFADTAACATQLRPAAVAAPSAVAAAASRHGAAPVPATRAPRGAAPFALTAEAHAAVCAACPAVVANPFLALVFAVVLQGRPQAFHVGRQTGAVFHPAHNWVASNISTALRRRLTQHRLMLEISAVQPLDEAQVLDQARTLYGRRDDGRRALDGFIWALVHNSFDDAPPPVDGALGFHLRRLPDFTRLPQVPDAFLQMALLCLRGPQTVAALRHAYPALHPDRVGLFVLCALLSGLAVVRPMRSGFPAAERRPAARPVAAPQRSVLRSLLARLF